MRKKNFKKLFQIIEQSYEILGIVMRQRITEQDIKKMIEESDMRILHMFMEHVIIS